MTEPTDAEIAACIEAANIKCVHPDAETTIEIARAVLAKWGTPAVAGEPVAWEATVPGYIKYVTQSRYEKFSAIAKGWYKPYKCSNCTTPQPTQPQAGAVPLTDEQIVEASCVYWGKAQLRNAFEAGARFAERHHGIKGGHQ